MQVLAWFVLIVLTRDFDNGCDYFVCNVFVAVSLTQILLRSLLKITVVMHVSLLIMVCLIVLTLDLIMVLIIFFAMMQVVMVFLSMQNV